MRLLFSPDPVVLSRGEFLLHLSLSIYIYYRIYTRQRRSQDIYSFPVNILLICSTLLCCSLSPSSVFHRIGNQQVQKRCTSRERLLLWRNSTISAEMYFTSYSLPPWTGNSDLRYEFFHLQRMALFIRFSSCTVFVDHSESRNHSRLLSLPQLLIHYCYRIIVSIKSFVHLSPLHRPFVCQHHKPPL